MPLRLLNFGHPLTDQHLAQIQARLGGAAVQVVDVPVEIDGARPLAAQVAALADAAAQCAGISPVGWQTEPLVVNLPGYAPAAAALLAELHGRMGHFPMILWLWAPPGQMPPRFEVHEVVNLHALREQARRRR